MPAATRGQSWLLATATLLLIATRSVDQTLFYRLNYVFESYVWLLATIILPCGYLLLTGPIVIYKLKYTQARRCLSTPPCHKSRDWCRRPICAWAWCVPWARNSTLPWPP